MRPVTAADLAEFWDSKADYLAADLTGGDLLHLDTEAFEGNPVAYDRATTEDREVLVLCEHRALGDGEWFPDLLDDAGDPRPEVLAEAAAIITRDGLLEQAMRTAVSAAEQWQVADQDAQEAAMRRARAVVDVVDLCGGSQSEAGRLLGLDQSRINRLVNKARSDNA